MVLRELFRGPKKKAWGHQRKMVSSFLREVLEIPKEKEQKEGDLDKAT